MMSNQTCDIHFSPREQEVLMLLGQYQNYGKISSYLGISRRTLHKHIEHISKKLKLPQKVGQRVLQDIVGYVIEHEYVKQDDMVTR
jgi:DNA-binding NarL/FixJ family response regulator